LRSKTGVSINNRTILCSNRTGLEYRVIRALERGSLGWAYEVQSPKGDRTIIEPPDTENYTILPQMFSLDLGQIVATPGVLEAMAKTGEAPIDFLSRHQIGDWGSLDREDLAANEASLKDGSRIFSAYLLKDGTKIYVITEAQGDNGKRESTCVLLPEEY
jgi:hypothetical protein